MSSLERDASNLEAKIDDVKSALAQEAAAERELTQKTQRRVVDLGLFQISSRRGPRALLRGHWARKCGASESRTRGRAFSGFGVIRGGL